jgi:predicted TIM-barrel fold metal-dependent hydrolase
VRQAIDFHVHLANLEVRVPWVDEWVRRSQGDPLELARMYASSDALVSMLRQNYVAYAVVLAELNPSITGQVRNENLAEFCTGHPELLPFADVNPQLYPWPARELDRLVKKLGFRGVNLYPTYQHYYPNEPFVYPIYEKAAELGIPVMVHTGSSIFRGSKLKYGDPLHLDEVAVDIPEVTLVIGHGGRGVWYSHASLLARLHPNVYIEIGGLPPQKLLDYFPDLERLSDKFMFGSDWPGVRSIASNIQALERLPISEEAKERILWSNAARVLKIPGSMSEV